MFRLMGCMHHAQIIKVLLDALCKLHCCRGFPKADADTCGVGGKTQHMKARTYPTLAELTFLHSGIQRFHRIDISVWIVFRRFTK